MSPRRLPSPERHRPRTLLGTERVRVTLCEAALVHVHVLDKVVQRVLFADRLGEPKRRPFGFEFEDVGNWGSQVANRMKLFEKCAASAGGTFSGFAGGAGRPSSSSLFTSMPPVFHQASALPSRRTTSQGGISARKQPISLTAGPNGWPDSTASMTLTSITGVTNARGTKDRRYNAGLQWSMFGRTGWAVIRWCERGSVPGGKRQPEPSGARMTIAKYVAREGKAGDSPLALAAIRPA